MTRREDWEVIVDAYHAQVARERIATERFSVSREMAAASRRLYQAAVRYLETFKSYTITVEESEKAQHEMHAAVEEYERVAGGLRPSAI